MVFCGRASKGVAQRRFSAPSTQTEGPDLGVLWSLDGRRFDHGKTKKKKKSNSVEKAEQQQLLIGTWIPTCMLFVLLVFSFFIFFSGMLNSMAESGFFCLIQGRTSFGKAILACRQITNKFKWNQTTHQDFREKRFRSPFLLFCFFSSHF
jgi:hypothetical protein